MGAGWKLVWEQVGSWFGSWLEAGLGVGWKLVWELVGSWFGSWLEAGLGACWELVWRLVGSWLGPRLEGGWEVLVGLPWELPWAQLGEAPRRRVCERARHLSPRFFHAGVTLGSRKSGLGYPLISIPNPKKPRPHSSSRNRTSNGTLHYVPQGHGGGL